MKQPGRPAQADWYSPYFAPTTVLIAITVLFVSIEAGKYTGTYFIERDRASQGVQTMQLTPTTPAKGTTKAAHHTGATRVHAVSTGKTQR